MAITRLKRKDRKNKARANNKQIVIKQLLRVPVIKNVDVEELKAQFGKKSGAGVVERAKEAISGAASTVAHKVEDVVEAVKGKVDNALHSGEEKSAE
jgi:phage-related protein